MASPIKTFDISNDGLINDVEEEMKKLINQGFSRSGSGSKHLANYANKPKYIETIDPDQTELEDLPGLFCWVDDLDIERNSVGQGSGNKVRTTYKFSGNYQYMIPQNQADVDDEEMKKVGWWLLDWIDQNVDLGGVTSGVPELDGLSLYPKFALVGNEVVAVSAISISAAYPFTYKKKATNNRNSKYTRG